MVPLAGQLQKKSAAQSFLLCFIPGSFKWAASLTAKYLKLKNVPIVSRCLALVADPGSTTDITSTCVTAIRLRL